MELIALTENAVHSVDKKAKIGACVSGSTSQYAVDLIQAGVADYIDFFSVHPYRILPEKGYENELKVLRRLFDENGGKDVELWQGEVGFGSYFPPNHFLRTWTRGSENLQARWLLRRFALDKAMGLKMSSFFQMVAMKAKDYITILGRQEIGGAQCRARVCGLVVLSVFSLE